MVSHMVDVLRRGFWASLTGGWFYDVGLDLLSNVVHLYLWGSLLVGPFILYMLFVPSLLIWGLYCAVVGFVFFVIKFGNHLMHRFFDTHESEGGKHGHGSEDKDGSSHGSLESLSEHLAAFCTDPDVLADWRRLHPRRRQSARFQTESNEDIALGPMNVSQASSATIDSGRKLPSGNAPVDIAAAFSPLSVRTGTWEEPQLDPPKAETSSQPMQPLDSADTINFRAEVYIHDPVKIENPVDQDSSKENDSLLLTERDHADIFAPADAVEKTARGNETSDSEAYDKFVSGLTVDPERSSAVKNSVVKTAQERTNNRRVRKPRKTRRTRPEATTTDSSVTSVLNQPTTSMETILSTFKPVHRNDAQEASTSQSYLSSATDGRNPSPKGLRRARSEFYNASSNFTSASQMISNSSLECVKSGRSSPPPKTDVQNSSSDNVSGYQQAQSTPNLDGNFVATNRPETVVDRVSFVDPLGVNCSDPATNLAKNERQCLLLDDGDYVPEEVIAAAAYGRSRSAAFSDGRQTDALVSRLSLLQRQVSVGANEQADCDKISHGRNAARDVLPGLSSRPITGQEHLLEQGMVSYSNDDVRANVTVNNNNTGDAYDPTGRGERPLCGSILLRRERENRALQRTDPQDTRARIESLTSNRGLMQTLTSWFAGNQQLPVRLMEEFSDGVWSSPADRPARSRATSRNDEYHPEEEIVTNRYSPQNSTVSSEARPEADTQTVPSRLTAVDSESTTPGRRPRITVLTNPFWQGDDAIHETTSFNEGTSEPTTVFDDRRNTWQLLPDSSVTDRNPRTTAETALVRACAAYGDEKSNSSYEYQLGPKTWKELFGDERAARHPRVRFKRPLYKIPVCPWFKEPYHIGLHLDRLTLTALFDRTRSVLDCVTTVILAVMVGALGGVLLGRNYFHDLWAFVLCFVIAGCQYSLLKSVQPDSASPTHGFNRIAVYSRAIYFCVVSGLILLMDHLGNMGSPIFEKSIFGFSVFSSGSFILVRDMFILGILCFPIVFAYGLLPQVNTFLIFFLEHIDIHVFGGSATCSLVSAVSVVFRNVVAVIALHGICYAALDEQKKGSGNLNLSFSLYAGLLIAVAYHLSRLSSDPVVLWNVFRRVVKKGDCQPWTAEETRKGADADIVQERIEITVYNRLRSDVIVCPIFLTVYFGLHGTTLFSINTVVTESSGVQIRRDTILKDVLIVVAVALGFVLSYVVPKLRAQMPWLCFSRPLVPSYRGNRRLGTDTLPPSVTAFEKIFLWLRTIERNILYPCILLSVLTTDTVLVSQKFGPHIASVFVTIGGLKFLRLAFGDTENQYLILAFTSLYFRFDAQKRSETFLLDYWLVSILFYKLNEWLLKWKFVFTYVAPWQITWGSAFHAFAQPFSIPHSGMLLVQTVISTIISSPLNPFLGSAIFLTSYPRPIKFWEKNYKTRRLDHSNTRLDAQLDGNSGNDDNNLNSIFYEHLTHSLQKSLCGDIMMGKWGNVNSGDFFILASDYLNCLVHVIEMGNGLITFQVRGLEFRGTYCQQREVEAITENVDENRGCCCFEPGHLPHMLSLNSAFNQRWLAWQVFAGRYVVQGYSVSDNNASTMFQIYDLRRILVTFYIKTIIYYLTKTTKLPQWLPYIEKDLVTVHNVDYHDLDPLFMPNIDVDFDFRYHGISRHSFYQIMHPWIEYCVANSEFRETDTAEMSQFVTLAFAMSVCGRRVLGAAAQLSLHSVDWFLHGLHALFKGDFRINCPRDEWVFGDIDLLHKIVAPAIRMALKLHQDHFTAPDEYERCEALYDAIVEHETSMVICHEGDPKWRQAVLANTPSLLALRHVVDDNRDDYKIIMLNIRNLDFRLININRECVRGFWAGQLQELVYFRNRNPERGSIQNAKQALRNMINSSCDQPIGYPIYVSPLTTSYADTHDKLCKVIGGPLTWECIRDAAKSTWEDVRDRCYASCSGSSGEPRIVRPREPPIVVSYNPQGQRQVEITRRLDG